MMMTTNVTMDTSNASVRNHSNDSPSYLLQHGYHLHHSLAQFGSHDDRQRKAPGYIMVVVVVVE